MTLANTPKETAKDIIFHLYDLLNENEIDTYKVAKYMAAEIVSILNDIEENDCGHISLYEYREVLEWINEWDQRCNSNLQNKCNHEHIVAVTVESLGKKYVECADCKIILPIRLITQETR